MNSIPYTLRVKNIGIDTYRENIIFMHADSHVCLSEGFTALTKVIIHTNENEIIATLNVINSDIITNSEAGLSIEAIKRFGKVVFLSRCKQQTAPNQNSHCF